VTIENGKVKLPFKDRGEFEFECDTLEGKSL